MNGIDMDLYEATTHPFIVKIWLEETTEEARRATWRGHITHVPSGVRRYVHSLADINAFIAPYLEGMGVQLDLCWRVRQWLKLQGHEQQVQSVQEENRKRTSERRTRK
jgi:hypothetical protein